MLVEYLCDNSTFRIKLFSDSTADAKKEKRAKQVAKDGKAVQYGVLAKHVFAEDTAEQARYANDPAKYSTSVETRFRRLKKEYKGLLEGIGATGAGLHPDSIDPGNGIRKKWPWWDDLHAFWRELPNYNPIGVQSSELGTDHAAAAADIFTQQTANNEDDEDLDEDEGEDGRSATSMARDRKDDDYGGDSQSNSSSPDDEDEDEVSPDAVPPPLAPTAAPEPLAAKRRRAPKTKAKTPAVNGRDLGIAKANAIRASSAPKKKPQNAVDRLNDLRESESLRLSEKRKLQHEEEMERISVKRLKYELKKLEAENERRRLNRHATS
ncbi:hypothetical protein DFH07DRAFT_953372 [Mycena maculata]|uniref:Uncharacterized protein n=1 Tax=Mycena maculata TaxID=230809 RepID=A0AAD7JUH2_9AGAR|nr:hypothetical protein DFH07DRAFT_953372 [Mycena maculata]